MKMGNLLLNGSMLLAIAAGGLYLYDDVLFHSLLQQAQEKMGMSAPHPHSIPASYESNNLSGTDWAEPQDVQAKVETNIIQALPATHADAVKQFLQVPQNRLMLAQWALAQNELNSNPLLKNKEEEINKQITKIKDEIAAIEKDYPQGVEPGTRTAIRMQKAKNNLAKLEAEAMQPHAILESISLPGAGKLMQQISNNLDWIEQFVWTGECVRPGTALAILANIVAKHPEIINNKVERDIATAVAIEFAKSGWEHNAALDRADFYLKHWRDGRLNSVFDTLPFWQRRMVVGCKGDNPWGSVESMQWSLDNVHLPADQYPGCCWRCGYKLYNLYGESIHGAGYQQPFMDFYGDNRAQFTYDVGGVCGSLSHFGAFAALANGVPAITAGEPAHCAYIVLVGDKWTPAYSLSWKRGLHWQVWTGVHKFSSLHMATKCYSPEEAENTQLSNAYRTLGALYAKNDDLTKAKECFTGAVKAQPLNYPAWRDYAQFLAAKAPKDADAWQELNRAVCNALVPTWPEMADQLLQQHIYADMQKALSEDAMQAEFEYFWNKTEEMGPDRWPIETLCDAQVKFLPTLAKDPDKLANFYGKILGAVVSKPLYSPVILGWGNTLAENRSEDVQRKIMEATVAGISKGANLTDEERDKMLAPAILAAEKMQDITTFQSLAKLVSAKYRTPANKLPGHTPFPGKLVSQGGIIQTSSTSNFENPCAHWGILEPVGGHFHTAKDKDAWVTVQLPKQAYVTGVVVINPGGPNMRRLNNMKIQVSETGKDGDWQDVADLGACKQRVQSADLNATKPRAKYVRILRVGGPEFFHLNAIYVYGEQAA